MLRYDSFSHYNVAQFQILLYIVTYLYRKSHNTIYRLTQKTVHVFFWQILFIYEWNVQMVTLKSEDTKWTRFCESGCMKGYRFEFHVLNGERKHLHINGLSHCPAKVFRFWKFPRTLYWTFNSLWILDLTPMHFYGPDNANAQRRYLVNHVVIAELIALNFFNIHKDDSELW